MFDFLRSYYVARKLDKSFYYGHVDNRSWFVHKKNQKE